MEVVENNLDITLAGNTIQWIGGLDESVLRSKISFEKTQKVIFNLAHFQTDFAQPIVLPFGLGSDLPRAIHIQRPLEVLTRYGVIQKLQKSRKGSFKQAGSIWAFSELKGEGGAALHKEQLSCWVEDLFQHFEVALGFDPTHPSKSSARKLVACWYYVVSQLDFSGEEELEPFDGNEFLVETLSYLTGAPLAPQNTDPQDNSEEDADYEPEKEMEEDNEDGEGHSEEQHIPLEEGLEILPQPTEKEVTVRKMVLRVVEGFGAYLPPPTEEQGWWQRIIKHMQLVEISGEGEDWYPWGCPPTKNIEELLQKEDPILKDYAKDILQKLTKQ
eukprot:TRINITY_DN5875_c0_g1_i1.p1 TRINITY_DN5875_c0_g1~~TRINITY_DN5875_c0_g1_i1.p1  ORF type:complete len:329 (-),score=114.83 TRINITY_DN5875_c0_g1_i1:7-993(-)